MKDTLMCISLWEPWATLVVLGAKSFETRSWRTSHRGPLGIHAAQGWHGWSPRRFCENPHVAAALRSHDVSPRDIELTMGHLIGVVNLYDCLPTTDALLQTRLSMFERLVGDFSPDRWAWRLRDVSRLSRPIRCRGWQRLFAVPRPVMEVNV